jgi:uncharacterized protein YbjT (DUF2867 family)
VPENGCLLVDSAGLVGEAIADSIAKSQVPGLRVLANESDRGELPDGVEVRRGPRDDPEVLTQALEGVGTVVVASLSRSAVDSEAVLLDVLDQATRPDLRVIRVSHLSAGDEAPLSPLAATHRSHEQRYAELGISCVNLRMAATMQHALAGGGGIREHGVLVTSATREDRIRLVDLTDVCEVVNCLLAHPTAPFQSISLQGPDLIGPYELAQAVSSASGHTIPVLGISEEVLGTYLSDEQIPTATLESIWVLHDALVFPPQVLPDPRVEDLIGHPLRTFTQFMEAHWMEFVPERDDMGNCTCSSCRSVELPDWGATDR